MQNTISLDEILLQELKDPAAASAYLALSFEDYEKDGDFSSLSEAVVSVLKAQGHKDTSSDFFEVAKDFGFRLKLEAHPIKAQYAFSH
jgi:hypothetical protein